MLRACLALIVLTIILTSCAWQTRPVASRDAKGPEETKGLEDAKAPEPAIDPQKEYNLKAVLMYSFGRYVTWRKPSANAGDFKVGVIGDSLILAKLKQVAPKRDLGGRKIVVEQVSPDGDLASYRLIFISREVSNEEAALAIATRLPNTIVIAERDELLDLDATVIFFLDGTSVRFELNRQNLQAKAVKVDAKLLRLSRPRPQLAAHSFNISLAGLCMNSGVGPPYYRQFGDLHFYRIAMRRRMLQRANSLHRRGFRDFSVIDQGETLNARRHVSRRGAFASLCRQFGFMMIARIRRRGRGQPLVLVVILCSLIGCTRSDPPMNEHDILSSLASRDRNTVHVAMRALRQNGLVIPKEIDLQLP